MGGGGNIETLGKYICSLSLNYKIREDICKESFINPKRHGDATAKLSSLKYDRFETCSPVAQ